METQNGKYNLEERTLKFAKDTRDYLRTINKDSISYEYIKQLTRSSSSIGANYIEANECLSKKDFVMRVKICRKETKESIYWLKLLECHDEKLINEATELMKIFGAIIEKCK